MLLVALVGCRDLGTANAPPTVSFVSPETGTTSLAAALAVDLAVADAEDDAADLTLAWSGTAASADMPAHVESDGHARIFLDLDAGAWTLSAAVTDTLGATATARTNFSTVEGDADGDGHVDVALGGDDCDDSDPGVSPAGVETCDDVDQDCDGFTDEGFDADGDGTTDCHDEETCDGLDNDGDGSVDEDDAAEATTWYGDADGDGYGGATSVASCELPAGYAANDDDCDDTDAAVSPGAPETCNGTDDDCDGTTDEGVMTTWYADADADGHGTVATEACLAPPGHVASAGDCDDADPGVSPTGVETCDDVDQDCDGSIDEGFDADGDGTSDCHDTEVCDGLDNDGDGSVDEGDASDASTWYLDGDADGWGGTTTVLSCETLGGYTAASGDCDDGAAGVNPGAAEVCDGVDQDCDGTADDDAIDALAWYADADADGYGDATASTEACDLPAGFVADDADCDDSVADVNPSATEVCNADDDDCDGTTDQGAIDAITWHPDADLDGYGDAGSASTSCTAPSGWIADDADCDDGSASISPAATEVCDAADTDEDCDGLADDDDPGVGGSTTFYADVDADGHGDPASAASACDLPSGHVTDATDCDDADAEDLPGGTETCNGDDEDCDGVADNGVETTYFYDGDADGHGVASPTADACSTPTGYAATDDDCDDADATVNPGEAEVCDDGVDDDCDGADGICGYSGDVAVDSAYDAKRYGDTSLDRYGYIDATSISGDFDGDGQQDLAGGAYGDDSGGSSTGSVWVESGPITAGASDVDDHHVAHLRGSSAADNFGIMVRAIPDWDDDGDDELWVFKDGSYGYVYEGPLTGSYTTSSGYAVYSLLAQRATGAGNWDGSGADEWAHVYDYRTSATWNAIYVNQGGSVSAGGATAQIIGESRGDYTGQAISGGPDHDVDGDGYDDLWFGAWGDDDAASNAGAVYVVTGGQTGVLYASAADNKLLGEDALDKLGYELDVADVNGDGYPDTLGGAPGDDAGGLDAGSVFIFHDALTDAATSDAESVISGPVGDEVGDAISVGEIDGDGAIDLLICDRDSHVGGSADQGTVWLVYGPISGSYDLDSDYDARWFGDAGSDYLGATCEMNGDVSGDGQDDIAIGGYGSDHGATSAPGAVFFFWGE